MELSKDVYWVGALDPDLRIFDIIMRADKGTTYNAYLIKGQKNALIDTAKEAFAGEQLARLEELIDLTGLDYIILNHTEPDHSGALRLLLDKAPNAQVLGSRAACKFIAEIINRPFNHRIVEDGEELDLGGKRLRFIPAPFLHWPDSIFTYLIEDEILFSCDVFGAHYCGSCQVFADQAKQLSDAAFKYYYDHIMRPFKEYVVKALDRIEGLPLKMIAPSHGPVLRENLDSYIQRYRQWSQPVVSKTKKAVIVYVSAYGNTKAMAYAIAEGIKQSGAEANVYDATEINTGELLDEIEVANALILGSPTINGDALKPVWDVINSLATIKLKDKVGAAFGSFGWSGEAVGMLTQRLKDLKLKTVNPGLRYNLVPTESDLEECRQFGKTISAKIG